MELVTARPHGLEAEWMSRIGECLKNGGRAVILVPPQETLNTELRLMEGLRLQGSFVLDVLSPGRLRERVFERAGRPDRVLFDERGKQMLLSATLEEEKENFRIYGRAAEGGSQSLAARLGNLIACLKRAGVTPEKLRARAEKAEGALSLKLADAALVYDRYAARLEGRLADAGDILEEERARLGESRVLADREVFISGFDIITPGFAAEIAVYERSARKVTLFVETDINSAPDGRLFAPVNASLKRMEDLLSQAGVTLKRTVCGAPEGRSSDLAALESGLYALAVPPYAGKPEHISLRAASSPEREVQLASSGIRRALAEGMHPSELAVVYPKGSSYAALLASVPASYGIAAYTAEKRPAAAHPLSRFVTASLRAIEEDGLRPADVVECLKSGFMDASTEEADAFASYCEQLDVRSLIRPFTCGLNSNMTEEELAALEETRKKAAEVLLDFKRELKEARNPDDVIAALLSLLERVQAAEKLEKMRMNLQEAGLDSEAEDCAQLWNALMETLDQLHDLLEPKTPVSLVRSMLETGLTALELSALPPAEGSVLCGEIGNLRTGHLKKLFVLGMNDREGGASQSLFSPAEQDELQKGKDGVFLGLTDPEREALASLDVLKVMTGTEDLTVSYALSDETGTPLQEGEAVQALRRLFPGLETTGGLAEEELPELLTAPEPAARALALRIRAGGEPSAEFSAAAAELRERSPEVIAALSGELQKQPERRLDPEQALDLYGRTRASASVSRLETFAACPYQYFIRYGLRPEEEREAGIGAAELGTMYHAVTEHFVHDAMREPGFPDLPPEKVNELTNAASEELLEGFRKTPYGGSRRGEASLRRIRKTARRVTSTLLHQYKEGKFRPLCLELAFGENGLPPLTIRLANGEQYFLRGRIDRIDILDADEKYIRIIDYKSSMKEVDPTQIYYGLQLQLCLYMAAALASIPGTKAAGFFYFHLKDPTVTSESRILEKVEQEIAKKLSLAGVCLEDVRILQAMDPERAGLIKKDGTVSKRSDLLDREEMKALLTYAENKAAELASEAQSGFIDDSPYELAENGRSACTFCTYHSACGFDPTRKPRRHLTKKSLTDMAAAEESRTDGN